MVAWWGRHGGVFFVDGLGMQVTYVKLEGMCINMNPWKPGRVKPIKQIDESFKFPKPYKKGDLV